MSTNEKTIMVYCNCCEDYVSGVLHKKGYVCRDCGTSDTKATASIDDFLPSEILYLFVGQITTTKKPVTASSHHDSAVWADLVSSFLKKHDLSLPRDGVIERYEMPNKNKGADNG